MEERAVNTTGELDEAEERTVNIYESVDYLSLNARRIVTQSTLYQQPGRTFYRAATMCLGLLCILLLAGIMGVGVHCRIKLQTHIKSGDENRKQTLVEIYRFCKDGCKSFNNSFYFISSGQKSWEDSRQDCKDRGADLIVVNSKEEQVFINSFKRKFWIGLSNRDREGTWKWVDGSVLNSTGFWIGVEPRGRFAGVRDGCVSTLWYRQQNTWNDDDCSKAQQWICEKVHDF
ncbi:CD209 antigen-like protein E [Seriola lalandi dorsalis]|uniref:CD209 antigen-like protein E n=1 Tax=Seriola lalandi dorsalis TaxID=1841481 RepID=UPI000C6F57DE|nr:CD209 antigen-like protein E [Seriola lalandi dorsalis]